MEDPILTINFNTLFLNPDNGSVYVVLFSLIVISYSIMPCGTHTFQCAFLNVGRLEVFLLHIEFERFLLCFLTFKVL